MSVIRAARFLDIRGKTLLSRLLKASLQSLFFILTKEIWKHEKLCQILIKLFVFIFGAWEISVNPKIINYNVFLYDASHSKWKLDWGGAILRASHFEGGHFGKFEGGHPLCDISSEIGVGVFEVFFKKKTIVGKIALFIFFLNFQKSFF